MIPLRARPFAREAARRGHAETLAIALVASAFLFGGQSVDPMLVQTIPQLIAVVVLGWIGWSARKSDFATGSTAILVLTGGLVLLIAAQVIPLPYAWWSALPGRDALLPTMRLAAPGAPWHALSEDPGATLQSAFTLLPAVAMLAVGSTLDREGMRRVIVAIVACALASLGFGLLQFAAGIDSPLYVYGRPEALQALGLFSNRNHQADALCIGLLMAGALQYMLAPRVRLVATWRLPIACAAAGLFGLGVLFTASRTGMLLFVPCAVLTVVAALRDRAVPRTNPIARVALVAIPLLFLLLGATGLAVLAERMQNTGDLRFAIWPDAWYLAQSVWPSGTGFGTFALAYQRVESLGGVTTAYINAAHNDYLQLLIEGGAAGVALLLAFLGWFGRALVQLARARGGMTGWFAAAGIGVLLVHSADDYPLRTEALSTLFATLCVILNLAREPVSAAIPDLAFSGGQPCTPSA